MRTHHANRFSTTLTSSMGPTALNASVVTTAGSPISPCYLVIDHDVPASAEIILFDGLFDGTTFRTLALANRYLDGSAAASGLTHAVGAKVIAAPLGTSLEDIWNEIEAEAAARAAADAAHIAETGTFAHAATSSPIALRHVSRDGAGRTQFAIPSSLDDAATKRYVDGFDNAWVSLATPSGWSLSGGRRRKIAGVVYVIGGWTRVSGSNPTSPTFDTLPAGFRPSELVPIILRHGSTQVLTGFVENTGAIVMDSATVAAGASIRFAVDFPADA